jgi:very-short-patch-repair endonuclease
MPRTEWVLINRETKMRRTAITEREALSFKNTSGQIAYWSKKYGNNLSRGRAIVRKYQKSMRRNPTQPELLMMQVLGALGIKYQFQKLIPFRSRPAARVADFFLTDTLFIIEVDGPRHFTREGIADDAKRNAQFASEYPHFKFIRYKNKEVSLSPGFLGRVTNDIAALGAGR